MITGLQKLPDFSDNHPLSDELQRRQQGVVTKGDGYVAPKQDKAVSLRMVRRFNIHYLARAKVVNASESYQPIHLWEKLPPRVSLIQK